MYIVCDDKETISIKNKEYEEYLKDHQSNVKKAWDMILINFKNKYTNGGKYSYMITNPHYSTLFDTITSNVNKHDASKFSDEEFDGYRRYLFATDIEKSYLKNTPQEKNFILNESNAAWLHHVHNNKHHWEYWVTWTNSYDLQSLRATSIKMPAKYMFEMLCDWFARSMVSGRSVSEWYYEQKENGEFLMHEHTISIVEDLIELCVE